MNQKQNRLCKKLWSLLVLATFGFAIFSPTADARLIFTTEDDGVNSDVYTLDVDGTVNAGDNTDLSLNFGANLGASIIYNDSTEEFTFTDDVNLGGNSLADFRLENLAADPEACVPGVSGRTYFNTTSNQVFYCDGTAWTVVPTDSLSESLADGSIFVGNAAGIATAVTINGDATIDNTGALSLVDGSVGTDEVADNTLTADDLAADSVTASELADNAVDSAAIIDGTITADDLGTDSVAADEIATGAVGTDEVADNTLTADDLAADSVTASELADNAVDTAAIVDNAVDGSKLGIGTTAGDTLFYDGTDWVRLGIGTDGQVLTTNSTADAPEWADVAASLDDLSDTNLAGLAAGNILTYDAVNSEWDNVALSGDGTIDAAGVFTLAADSVTATELADNAVDSAAIIDGTITADDLGTDSVAADEIATGAVGTDEVADNTLTADDLAADSVTASELADNAVDNASILDDAVTVDKIGTAGATDGDSVLTTDAAGNAQWETRDNFVSSALTSGQILVGDAAGVATGVAVSGDATIDNTGAFSLAADSVASAEILDGSITADDLGTDSVGADEIATGAVGTDEVADNSLTADDLATDSVDTDEIATDAVTTDEILDGTITQDDIAAEDVSVSMPPEFPNFTLFADGTNNRGTFESGYDPTEIQNFYQWSTRRVNAQDYDLVVQWPIPEDFDGWQAAPLSFNFRTNSADALENNLDLISIRDTAGVVVPGAAATDLVNTAWTTQAVTGLEAAGTYDAGQFITMNFRFEATELDFTQLGNIVFNYTAK